MSFADYLIFGNKLKSHQIAGITFISISIVLLSLRDVINPPHEQINTQANYYKVSIMVPLLFAILTPISFTGSAIYGKSLAQPRIGFEPTNLAFNCQLIVNLVILIVGVYYWTNVSFNPYIFVIGLASGLFESLGKTCIATAVTIGLAGPASAITSLSGVQLVIVNILRFHKMISLVESISILLSLVGSAILVVPGLFNMLLGRKTEKEFTKIESADE